LARKQYFDEGLPPSGIVSEAVFQSWARCQRRHAGPRDRVTFQPVSQSRTHLALQKNRELQQAWLQELPHLQAVLGRTSCAAMLTDATGVLIGATCVGRPHEMLMPIATRLGVNLSEEAVGTTAPGVVARTGQAVSVMGPEHFFDEVRAMHCAAAPIRDTRGRLAGVLDISSEEVPFTFDAVSVLGLYAGAIENRLLLTQSREHLVVRFQVETSLLDSSLAAFIGIDTDGRLAWRNATASRLLGLRPFDEGCAPLPLEEAVGASFAELASLPNWGATVLRLHSGLVVWARSEMRALDGHRDLVRAASVPPPVAMPQQADADVVEPGVEIGTPANDAVSLRASERDFIAHTVDECGGNVSKAARKLGVSRGLIYRRLKEQPPPA
jgi:transcriptional regulator of acetoin/glycerol metabolism